MRILTVGGGPSGLYFALLRKKRDPRSRITVVERNRPGDTFGFGVVFSDATMDNLARADAETHAEITRAFAHWGDIEMHFPTYGPTHGREGGHPVQVVRSTGHGFAGIGRRHL